MGKKIFIFLLGGLVIINASGCGPLRKKFIRKKKEITRPTVIGVREYDVKPSLELYTKHYIYWQNWHRELLEVMGRNTKKDVLCIDGIVSNLRDMQNNLIEEKRAKLQRHIDKLAEIEAILKVGRLSQATKDRVFKTLETESRAIKRDFTSKKMGPYIADEFAYKVGPLAEPPKEGPWEIEEPDAPRRR